MRRSLPPCIFVVLWILLAPASGFAQSADDAVLQALKDVQDPDRPLSVRAQIVSRLLAEKDPRALERLGSMLTDAKTPDDVRMMIVTGVLTARGLPLLDAVLDLVTASQGTAIEERIHDWFLSAATGDLANGLLARIRDPQLTLERRLVAIRLLGETRRKEAVPALIDLWEKNAKPVSTAAQEALGVWTLRRFESPEAARAFWEKRQGQSRERILEDLLREELDGQRRDPAVGKLVDVLVALLPNASLDQVLGLYLTSELPDIRAAGAGRLGTYPYDEREGERAAEAKQRAAEAIVARLDAEEETPVIVALLGALRKLVGSLPEERVARVFDLLSARVGEGAEAVRKEAVVALGALGDPRAIPLLRSVYEEAKGVELRLAALDAIDLIGDGKAGDGITVWVLSQLRRHGLAEPLVLRLIRLLREHDDLTTVTGATPVLTGLLANRENPAGVRLDAASTLGIIGERAQSATAFAALAQHGLSDPDESVRDRSAAQLGAAKQPTEEIVAALRERLGEKEQAARVRATAARSLLRLRGLPELSRVTAYLGDEDFWNKAPRRWLTTDLLATGRTADAVAMVKWLAEQGFDTRAAEAARVMLTTKDLVWGGTDGPDRAEVVTLMVASLERGGQPEQALAALRENAAAFETNGGRPASLDLAEGRLLLATGQPAAAEAKLKAVAAQESAPTEIRLRARVVLGRTYLAQGRLRDATIAVEPALADPERKEEATRITDEARRLAGLLADLDGEDTARRDAGIAALRDAGRPARPALLAWLNERPANRLAAAVDTISVILGVPLTYDPAAPAEARKAALEAARKALTE